MLFRNQMRKILSCCLFVVALNASKSNAESPYPFTGAFGVVDYGAELWKRQKNACLTSFYTQSDGGSYFWYHVDTDRLRDKDELSYVVWESGKCTWDAANRIEVCMPEYSIHKIQNSYARYLGEDFDDTGILLAGKKESLLNPTITEPQVWQVRCRLGLKGLTRYMSTERTSYDAETVDRIVWREPGDNIELLNRIREKLGISASRQSPKPYRYADQSTPRVKRK